MMAKFLDPNRADEISKEMISLCKRRLIETGHVDPTTLLAGLCQGLVAFMDTAPPRQPITFTRLRNAAADCLQDMRNQAAEEN